MSKETEIERGQKLLATPKGLLTSIQQQEKFLFSKDSLTPPCAGCGEPLSKVEAAPDTYRIGFSEGDDYDCPRCRAALRYILPFFGGGWHWQLREPPFKAAAPRGQTVSIETAQYSREQQLNCMRPCPGCGRLALDGKVTCGDAACGSSMGADR